MSEYMLEAVNITKKFPGVVANDQVCLRAKGGEVLGLIGENGAGKSTLLKILNGVYPHGSYTGSLYIAGKEVRPADADHAMRLGIGFVPQEINVLKNMSVAENIFVSNLRLGRKSPFVSHKEMRRAAAEILEKNHIALDPQMDVRKLSIGQQQMLMIAKALSTDPRILILDEPTTSLSDVDVNRLFDVVRDLKARGVCVIFVTHKMDEILQLTDRVCVLRDGKNVALFEREEYDRDKIIEAMIGRQLTTMYPERHVAIGDVVLEVKHLSVLHPYIQKRFLVEDISFNVRRGEVVALAGLVGAGRSEVVQAIFGMMPKAGGSVLINGGKVNISNPSQALKNGVALVTEDRKKYGLIHIWSIMKNISLSGLDRICRRGLVISAARERDRAGEYFRYLRVKAPSLRTRVDTLSGGNQQKVVIARSLNAQPQIVMLDEPTKGIDVGSKYEIYQFINDLAAQGKAIIMISSELPELMAMSDRFYVMAQGHITAQLSAEEASTAKIMQYATTTYKGKGDAQ